MFGFEGWQIYGITPIFQESFCIFTQMETKVYYVIGVMSGTSLDGIDLAYVQLIKSENWDYRFLKTQTLPYSETWKEKLREAPLFSSEKLMELNTEYTGLLAEMISDFIEKNDIETLDAVCSHGHTVFHQPEKGVTLQIGNLPSLAENLQQTVICDFRKQDVEMGGQGAPLVPIGDKLLFPKYDFCLNLGGFANLSTEKNGKRIAYDICAVNTVLNFYAKKIGFEYDKNGELAASGKIDHQLLKHLNHLPFYKKRAPKSLGIEWVNAEIFPLLKKTKLSERDILATFTEHVAQQIGRNLGNEPDKKCLCTGGGAYNNFLMESIQKNTKTRLVIPDKDLVEFKEALIFGLLGVLKLRNEINVLQSVTGAKNDHSSGVVWRV